MLKQFLKKAKQKERRSAFTMIELLLVIAIIAVLAGIVMSAINIPGFLGDAYDAERTHNVNQLENAMYQHLVDNWEILNEVDIPEGAGNAKDVCKFGVADDTTCVNLDGLIPIFMAGLPADPAETNANYTGYKVYKTAGRPRFKAAHLGKLPAESVATGPGPLCDSSLIAYWKFDEDSGSNATDSSGNGNDGTLQNMEDGDWIAGTTSINFANPSALDFNESNEFVDIGSLDLGSVWSISVWFEFPFPSTASWNTLTRGSSADHQVIIRKSDGHMGAYDNGGTNFNTSGYDTNGLSNGWHQLVAVGNGGTTEYYIDGLSVGNVAFQSTSDIRALGNYWGGGQQFGKIDDLRVYNRALSITEIETLRDGDGECINPGVTVSSISGPTSEAGGTATFTVVLDSLPTGDVVIDLLSQNSSEGLVTSPVSKQLTFNSGNWSDNQMVTVTGQDDALTDGNIVYTVAVDVNTGLTAASEYDPINPSDVSVTNNDDESVDPLCDSSLVAYWRFDETAGNTAADSSGNGNGGTLQNMEDGDWTTDTPGLLSFSTHALDFDGVNEYVDIGLSSLASITEGDFTVSLWYVKPSGTAIPSAVSFGIPANWSSDLFILYIGESAQSNGFRVWWNGSSPLIYPTDVTGPNWQHVVLTRSGSNFEIYLDGGSVQTGFKAASWTSSSGYIGAANNNGSPTQHFGGKLDDIRIYDRVLTGPEITTLATGNGDCS